MARITELKERLLNNIGADAIEIEQIFNSIPEVLEESNNEKLREDRVNKLAAIKNGFIKEQIPELLSGVAGIKQELIQKAKFNSSDFANASSIVPNEVLVEILATLKNINNFLRENNINKNG